MSSSLALAFTAVFPVLVEASAQSAPPIAVARRDSAGITIVASAPSATPPLAPIQVDTTPVLSVTTGVDNEPLRDVVGGMVLRSGSIVVGDRARASLLFYSRFGVFSKETGGPGSTTGRFISLRALFPHGDTVVACCAPGVARYSAAGNFVASTPAYRGDLIGVLQTGRYLVRKTSDETRAYQGQKGVVKTLLTDTLFSMNRQGGLGARMAVVPSRIHVGVYNPDPNPLGLSVTFLESPFEPESYYAASGGGFLYTDGRSLEARQYASTGRLTHIYRVAIPASEITGTVSDQFRQAILRKYTVVETRRYIEWVLEQYVSPARLPQTRALLLSSDGKIWLREHAFPAAPMARWHVLAADGAYQGSVQLPARWKVHQVGSDFVLASDAAPSGGVRVGVYRLASR